VAPALPMDLEMLLHDTYRHCFQTEGKGSGMPASRLSDGRLWSMDSGYIYSTLPVPSRLPSNHAHSPGQAASVLAQETTARTRRSFPLKWSLLCAGPKSTIRVRFRLIASYLTPTGTSTVLFRTRRFLLHARMHRLYLYEYQYYIPSRAGLKVNTRWKPKTQSAVGVSVRQHQLGNVSLSLDGTGGKGEAAVQWLMCSW
jgi:hypothetical protein